MTEVTVSTILESVGAIFTQAVTWMGNLLNVVASNPILLIFVVAIPIMFVIVAALRGLIRL